MATALVAARTGAETLLLEKESNPGGNVTQAYVHTICGLFELSEDHPEYLHTGLPEALSRQLIRDGFGGDPEAVGKVFVQPIFPERLGQYLRKHLRDVPNLDCEFNTAVRGVTPGEKEVELTVEDTGAHKQTQRTATNVVDASGDAVSESSGESGDTDRGNLQLPSLIFIVEGVDDDLASGYGKLRLTREVASGVKEGELPEGCESILVRPGRESGQAYVTLNIPRDMAGTYDPFDPEALARFEEEARRRAALVVGYLRESREELSGLTVSQFPERIGVRETRRVNTRYTMTEEDVLEGCSFEDAVTQSAWPIELWQEYTDADFEYPEGPVDVPLDALVAERSNRIGTAGRCLGATHRAAGSLRVLGTALATGQAIGVAGGLASESDQPLATVEPELVRSTIKNLNWNESLWD